MTYKEYIEKEQALANALPVFYAFSDEQFMNQLEKRGLTLNDLDKLYRLGDTGGFYLKSDADKIKEYFERPDELSELLKDYDFAFEAFYYEMGNHEYHINWEADYSVCSCFGHVEYDDSFGMSDYFVQLKWNETTIKAYKDARNKFLHDCDEGGWY